MSDATAAKIKMHGIYIYQFAKNVYWPSKYTSGDFEIGIYGNKDVFDQLRESYDNKMNGSQNMKFHYYPSIKDIEDCHLLYVCEEKNGLIDQVNKAISKKTVLVSEGPNLDAMGSMINFIYIGSKLKYQINQTKANNEQIKIGQLIVKLAHTII